MDTLHDRLAKLADDAPVGGAPAAELWARGKRAHRFRVAALAVSLLVVGAVGLGIGLRVADEDNRDALRPAGHLGFTLPIAYPAGEQLPSLGRTPGPLAAIWTDLRPDGAPVAVGLVAATGKFGNLPIALPDQPPAPGELPGDFVALSPDGRRIAYWSSTQTLIVRDLVGGETYTPAFTDFKPRGVGTWVDATHLVGNVYPGSDIEGWIWQPGQLPKRVNPYPWLDGYHGQELWGITGVFPPSECATASVNRKTGSFVVPGLCDVLGFVGSDFVLGHQRKASGSVGPVVAVDVRGATAYSSGRPPPARQRNPELRDPSRRHLIAWASAPAQVDFATDLIGEALGIDGGTP